MHGGIGYLAVQSFWSTHGAVFRKPPTHRWCKLKFLWNCSTISEVDGSSRDPLPFQGFGTCRRSATQEPALPFVCSKRFKFNLRTLPVALTSFECDGLDRHCRCEPDSQQAVRVQKRHCAAGNFRASCTCTSEPALDRQSRVGAISISSCSLLLIEHALINSKFIMSQLSKLQTQLSS